MCLLVVSESIFIELLLSVLKVKVVLLTKYQYQKNVCIVSGKEETVGCRKLLNNHLKMSLLQHVGKGHPRTGHEGLEGEQIYSSTLPSTWALDGGWVVNTTPRPLYPRERPGTHCIGGWVGPRAGLDGCRKYCAHRHLIPGPSSPQRAIPAPIHIIQTLKL